MSARLLVFVASFSLLAAASASAGPPWISIEIPANPFDSATKDAFLVVRTYHHGNPIALQLRGTMEGIVDGKRVTRRLVLERTRTAGLWVLKSEVPSDGAWVLVLVGGDGDYSATALVDVMGGAVRGVEVPRRGFPYAVPRKVEPAEVEARLQALAALSGDVGPRLAKPGRGPSALLVLGAALGLLPVGVFAVRRARRR